MLTAWVTDECERCFGMGMELGPDHEELTLCPDCKGYGRIPRKMQTQGFYALVAAMALKEGWATRTRAEQMRLLETGNW